MADVEGGASVARPTLESVLAHGPVRWAMAGPEAVVHVPSLAATHVLDPSAAVLWQCLDGAGSLREIFADMAEAFRVPPAVVAADCLPVIGSWLTAGIVREATQPHDHHVVGRLPDPAASLESGRTWRRLVDPPST